MVEGGRFRATLPVNGSHALDNRNQAWVECLHRPTPPPFHGVGAGRGRPIGVKTFTQTTDYRRATEIICEFYRTSFRRLTQLYSVGTVLSPHAVACCYSPVISCIRKYCTSLGGYGDSGRFDSSIRTQKRCILSIHLPLMSNLSAGQWHSSFLRLCILCMPLLRQARTVYISLPYFEPQIATSPRFYI